MKPYRTVGDCRLYQGDALAVLAELAAGSVQCCVTSPPYWNLRDYQIEGQLGQEPTPHAFVANLVGVFRQVRRVLHATGTLWVNLADSMGSGHRTDHGTRVGHKQQTNRGMGGRADPARIALGSEGPLRIPQQFVEAMIADGWHFRMEMVWVKLAPMPESVSGWRWERCRVKVKSLRSQAQGYASAGGHRDKRHGNLEDQPAAVYAPCPGCPKCRPHGGYVLRKGRWRPSRAHEYLYLFSKSERYFIDQMGCKQPARTSTVLRDRYTRVLDDPGEQFAVKHDHETDSRGLANPRSWLVFKGEPLREQHYAAFPPDLPAFCLRAATSKHGQCPQCGTPWARVLAGTLAPSLARQGRGYTAGTKTRNDGDRPGSYFRADPATKGWRPCCGCPTHKPVPQTALDCFGGSGSTGVAAIRNHRRCVLVDLSREYLDMGTRRLKRSLARRGLGAF